MNKILIGRDRIIANDDGISVSGNVITLSKNMDCMLEYDTDEISLEIRVKDSVSAVLYESSFVERMVIKNKYVIDGSLLVNKFYNCDSVNEEVTVDLNSSGAKIYYHFSNICRKREEYTININHLSEKTVSNISNKAIVLDNARIDFVINSKVEKEYVDSVLDQNTRIVTFGNGYGSVSPNMFIDCDMIEARHGSVIGTFKDEMVFYLMSRGISYNESIKLLVKGYLFSNISGNDSFREMIFKVIEEYWNGGDIDE